MENSWYTARFFPCKVDWLQKYSVPCHIHPHWCVTMFMTHATATYTSQSKRIVHFYVLISIPDWAESANDALLHRIMSNISVRCISQLFSREEMMLLYLIHLIFTSGISSNKFHRSWEMPWYSLNLLTQYCITKSDWHSDHIEDT